MKALVYHGPGDVQIDDKPRPNIQIHRMLFCVSPRLRYVVLTYLYHGAVQGMEPGQTLRHEFMGVVEEAGTEVHEVKVGDRVVIPCNIDCGHC
jgi:S-(hydroxymethyl)glutathione dehydrogenase / alcohol dehydrogenase